MPLAPGAIHGPARKPTRAHPPPRLRIAPDAPSVQASSQESARILGCLIRARLTHVSSTYRSLWVGYDSPTSTLVYVQLYRTRAGAAAEARKLADEESVAVGPYLMRQPIAPYTGSPVPVAAACVAGHPVRTPSPGKRHRKGFVF